MENQNNVLMEADHVKVYFKGKDKKSGTVKAVDDVSFQIMRGETFGVVGESGCGKSTLGRSLVRLLKPTGGHIYLDGTDIAGLKGKELKNMRKKAQIIFQDPSACLNPRRTVKQILMEPFEIHGLKGQMDVDARIRAVEGFWKSGTLDVKTNVQFGEGGAGTFSDGKLTTRIHDPRCGYVMEQLARFGAPAQTMRRAKPHIGTDKLRMVVKNIRREIERMGGEIKFGMQVEDLLMKRGKLVGLIADRQPIACDQLILAVGHSARDTFEMLMQRQIPMVAKAFSVGVRIEHLQSVIDRGLYGNYAGHPALDKGEYQLSYREGERGVYTFCMCPGGIVVPSASEPQAVVTNGMSEYARDGKNANSALVVSVDQSDFGAGPMDGIAFQRSLERAAFSAGGGRYAAPGQTAKSFLDETRPALPNLLEPTYTLGVRPYPLKMLFPSQINRMLENGLRRFERRIPGFSGADAFLTGVETRTSSPIRILREEDFQSPALKGLYPCGEGAGYAGGIVSAAVDGVRVAQQIIGRYAPAGDKGKY